MRANRSALSPSTASAPEGQVRAASASWRSPQGETRRSGGQTQIASHTAFALVARWFLRIAFMVLAFGATQGWASDVKSALSCKHTKAEKVCGFDIDIEGEITPSTPDAVKKALADYDQMVKREGSGNDWLSIKINSPGGSVNAAIEIARLLRSMDAPIAVGPEKICVSACVLVLAGSPHRLIFGRIGIHRPYFETPKADVSVADVQKAYSSMTEQIRSFFREMNVSDRLADDMMLVPPEEIRFLSSDEIAGYGLGFLDPVAKEASDLQEAKKLGVDRREYMQRRSLSERLCQSISSTGAATYVISQACVSAILSGKHVERAPHCRNMAATCQPWEREWNGRKLDASNMVTDDGYLVSDQ